MQPGRLLGQYLGDSQGEAAVAAQAALDDLFPVHPDQAVGPQPVKRGVQGSRAQLDPVPEICLTSAMRPMN